MKILIIYGTKYGCTKKCAQLLKDRLLSNVTILEATSCNLDLSQFDAIIIGGSVYMGKMRKEITRFIKRNKHILGQKRVGLFACCYTPTDAEGFLETIFPTDLLQHAVCATTVGGEMDYQNMNFAYRKLFQSLKKIEGFNEGFSEPSIRINDIQRLADAISK